MLTAFVRSCDGASSGPGTSEVAGTSGLPGPSPAPVAPATSSSPVRRVLRVPHRPGVHGPPAPVAPVTRSSPMHGVLRVPRKFVVKRVKM